MAVNPRVVGTVAGAALAIASVMVAGFEGRRLHAYQDAANVWTICDGHTRGVRPGDVATVAQCEQWLIEDLEIADGGVSGCIHATLNRNQRAALDSFFYNVGVPAGCASTLARKANAGLPFCAELLRWTHADGKELRGLVKRRRAEYDICIKPDFSNVE